MGNKHIFHAVTVVCTIGIIHNFYYIRQNLISNTSKKINSNTPEIFPNIMPGNSGRNHPHGAAKLILHWTGWYNRTYLHESNMHVNWYQKHCPEKYGTGK